MLGQLFVILWIVLMISVNLFNKKSWYSRFISQNLLIRLFFNEWRVFSPKPFNSDLKIYYRDLLNDNSTTALREVVLLNKSPFFFNTSHRERNLINKLIANGKFKTEAYKLLKQYIKDEYPLNNVNKRQICIVRSFGFHSQKKEVIELIDYV